MRVLAIDPGYERLGIAVVEKDDGKETLVASHCFQTSTSLPHAERLAAIANKVADVIATHSPKALAIETLFFSVNQKTAIKVAEARGVVLSEAARAALSIHEFSPQAIKIATTGHGNSSKQQVLAMVTQLITIPHQVQYDDEYDAIATGLTFFATSRSAIS